MIKSNRIKLIYLIFFSESFASINIPLVAVWMSTLTEDEVERFRALKSSFSEEQKAKDEMVDAADYAIFSDARNLDNERMAKDREWAELLDRHVLMQKEERYTEFANSLQGNNNDYFNNRFRFTNGIKALNFRNLLFVPFIL